jgi:hypothetical protein
MDNFNEQWTQAQKGNKKQIKAQNGQDESGSERSQVARNLAFFLISLQF